MSPTNALSDMCSPSESMIAPLIMPFAAAIATNDNSPGSSLAAPFAALLSDASTWPSALRRGDGGTGVGLGAFQGRDFSGVYFSVRGCFGSSLGFVAELCARGGGICRVREGLGGKRWSVSGGVVSVRGLAREGDRSTSPPYDVGLSFKSFMRGSLGRKVGGCFTQVSLILVAEAFEILLRPRRGLRGRSRWRTTGATCCRFVQVWVRLFQRVGCGFVASGAPELCRRQYRYHERAVEIS